MSYIFLPMANSSLTSALVASGLGVLVIAIRARRNAFLARQVSLHQKHNNNGQHIVDIVRESCAFASNELKHIVRIDLEELKKLGSGELLATPPQWDEFDWHCSRDKYGDELTARYVFVLDALNYCFWPNTQQSGLEYLNLARGLRKACDRGERFQALENVTAARVSSWLEAPHKFPQLDTRVEAIRSLGTAFVRHGDAIDWLRQCQGSAVTLVDMVHNRLPKFRDETTLHGRRICFYKRAQILVADVWAAFGQKAAGLGGFHDIDSLTIFADYRVPQLMRDMGILVYNEELSKTVDERKEIPPNSDFEIAIRATSVHAVELLKQLPKTSETASDRPLISVEVDWVLWQKGEARKSQLRPHHRTLTTFY